MRNILQIITIFIFSSFYSQDLTGTITDSLNFRKWVSQSYDLKIVDQKNNEYFIKTDKYGKFEFKNLLLGKYKLYVLNKEYEKNIYSIDFPKQNNLNLYAIKYCKYHENNSKVCPICKSDKNVVPIFYGLTTKKNMKKNKGKYHFSGCVVSTCSPKFYCKKHKKKF